MQWHLTSEELPTSDDDYGLLDCLVWVAGHIDDLDDDLAMYVKPHAEAATWSIRYKGWMIPAGIDPDGPAGLGPEAVYEYAEPSTFPYWIAMSDVPGPA